MPLFRFPAIASALTFAAALGAPVTASATHSWNGYHWARPLNPFTLKVGDNLSSTWDSYLGTTSTDWSKSAIVDMTVVAGGANPRNCRPTSGRVEVCNSTYGNNGWLGVAQVWVSGKHIGQGTVKMNDTYFITSAYNTSAWRNLVMCQEVGHTLGLDHQDENFDNKPLGTCMDYTSDPSPNQHPNQHDYDELDIIYLHADSSTTLKSLGASIDMPPAFANALLDTPDQWGRLVRSSRGGRIEVYERDFGGGRKVTTFVIWAE